jgi:molybdopterin-containing oxidoreductase family iron-sulfur binding subunit
MPSRRDMLKLMAASLALAGCDGPQEEARTYVERPEGVVPGRPQHYATAWVLDGIAQPVVATCREGRPVKLEGNPDHPASGGVTDAFTQAAILQLYDPDRSSLLRKGGAVAAWTALEGELARRAEGWRRNRGKGLAILTGAVTSPTLLRQLTALGRMYPLGAWYAFEPVDGANRAAGLRQAFGRRLDAHMLLERARVVVSLDDDLLGPGPRQALYARRWAKARVAGDQQVFAAESVPGLLGCQADYRIAAAPSRQVALLAALAGQAAELSEAEAAWVQAAQGALALGRGHCLVAVGPHLPAAAHAVAAGLNADLEAAVAYTEALAAPRPGLDALAKAIDDGAVDTLVVVDANPVYAAGPGFAARLVKVPLSIHAGMYDDETAALCSWHLPLAHPFETWGDARAADGTATLIQPLVRPLKAGWSPQGLLAALAGRFDLSPRDIVRDSWGRLTEAAWSEALKRGFVDVTAAKPLQLPPPRPARALTPAAGQGVEVVVRPSAMVWDGRLANNAWLHEVGDPLTKIVWDNAASLSPATAARLGVNDGDKVRVGGIVLPVAVMPNHADEVVGLTLGYGRRRAGRVGSGVGVDVTPLVDASFATVERAVGHVELARLQTTQRMHGQPLVAVVAARGAEVAYKPETDESLFPPWHQPGHAWGMVIDQDLCIGCNTCVVACQAENNIPVVGRHDVGMGRAMHWIRVDRYHQGDMTHFQPVPCMHCDHAPCEIGCPVHAAVHSSEGINQQVYNRCIGTRTCAVYCPYEVRRFNFLTYSHEPEELPRLQRNPEVTVRGRGVMEKCTYCIQRIEAARIDAEVANRPLARDSVTPACAQACPTGTIVFGDLADPESRVSAARGSPRNYALLPELNTRPRTTYLARVRRDTPSPLMGEGRGGGDVSEHSPAAPPPAPALPTRGKE